METGYLKDGTKVHIDQKLDEGYIVQKYFTVYYESEYNSAEEEELCNEKIFVPDVFKQPPTEAIDSTINDLNKRIDAKREVISALSAEELLVRKSLSNIQKSLEDMEKNAKAVSAIQYIFDYINGDFNYFAMPNSYGLPKICDKNLALDSGEKYEKDTKLLTLFGSSKGDLKWMINQYRDGSGGQWNVAQPCKTMEEAKEFIKNDIYQRISEYMKSERSYFNDSCIEWMKSNKYDLPDDFKERYNKDKLETLESNIEKYRKDEKQAQDNLIETKKNIRAIKF